MLTIAQKLEYCKVCTNRTVDFSKGGLICSITQEQAKFEDECPKFNLDKERQQEVIATKEAFEKMEDVEGESDGTRDMILGAVWCLGGLTATVADIGFIFYGAIIFGAFQFIQGVIKSNS